MTLTVTHTFSSPVADDPQAAGAGDVLPSHWNANHTIALTSGYIPVGNTSNVAAGVAVSGDGTLSNAGALVITKTNGTNFGTFATQNYATPPAIGGTTPNTGNFTTLTATNLLPGSTVQSVVVVGTGVDDTTAFNSALSTLTSGTGGVLYIKGHVVVTSAVVPAYTGSAPPRQVPIRITGQGSDFDSTLNGGAATTNGAIFDLRYDGTDTLHPAKIDTRGSGILEIDHLTLFSGGTDDLLFCQTTNTALNVHDVHVSGHSAHSGTSCVQDVFQLGGITSAANALGGVLSTNGFQGYGSVFSNITFSNIRHAFNFGGSANAIHFSNIMVDFSCGSSETYGAPFYFYGTMNPAARSNTFLNCSAEVAHYPYYASMVGSQQMANHVFIGGGAYDPGGGTVAMFYLDSGAIDNIIIPAWPLSGSALPVISGTGTGNIYIKAGYGINVPVVWGGPATNTTLDIYASSSGSASGDAVRLNVNAAPGLTVKKTGSSFSMPLSVAGAASTTGLGVAGVAANLFVDYSGGGNNYYDAANHYFRNFAGTALATLNSSNLNIPASTASTSSSTGAIVASGGAGIGGALYAGGALYGGSTSFLIGTKAIIATGAGSSAGTITNAPSVGNPTKWIPIDDNGTTRYIPAW